MTPHLSDRLGTVVSLSGACRCAADVGCDHAFVPISLVQSGQAERAIAMDVRKGPLSIARRNILEAGLSDRIETRLSDGLEALHAGEADLVIIAGMGGLLMQRILREGAEVLRSVDRLVLSPQSDADCVRRTVCSEDGSGLHFSIEEERFLKEDGKYYTVMRLVRTDAPILLAEEEARFGPHLLASRDPLLYEWLKSRREQLSGLISSVQEKAKPAPDAQDAANELKEALRVTNAAIERYEMP